jgi:DNA mismatch repair protein MutL
VPHIQVLPPSLVNQIAAGEVVERPASIVKELVENALDAGARSIQVEIEEGGLALVRVADDGSGMEPEDAALCLERHATSKLKDVAGLSAIATMGFRGEALPAIASVSRLRIDTCAAGEVGTRLVIEGGDPTERSEVARARGTTIEVRDLFFNTPARRKFMRAPATESGHASEALLRLALARPDVGFLLRSASRTVFSSVPGSPLRERAAIALGREAQRHLLEVDATRGDLRVRGLVSSPDHSEATSRAFYLFVNGRYVRDRGAAHAVLRAYAGTLPAGRHPAAVLFLEMPLSRVDVNVHPQKLEVRFAEAREVQDALFHAVAERLRTAPWLRHAAGHPSPSSAAGADGAPSANFAIPASAVAPAVMTAGEEIAAVLDLARAQDPRPAQSPGAPWPRPLAWPPGQEGFAFPIAPVPSGAAPVMAGYFGSLRYVGQHARTYLLCEAPGGTLVIIDQHASHERVLYHRFRQAFTNRQLLVQPFLIPQILALPVGPARSLEANLPELAKLGFEVEPFGGESFAVKGAPAALGGVDLAALLTDLSQELEQAQRIGALEDVHRDLLATMACHAAVRANQDITAEEVRALLDSLDGVDFKARCPHGRPVVFELSLADLEKKVGRR